MVMKMTFVIRELGKTGSELTKDEFIKMMMEDIEIASEEYRKWSDEVAEQKYIKDSEAYAIRRQQVNDRIVEESYKKYKRESYRLRWVEKMMTAYPEVLDRDSCYHCGRDLKYIRWDIKPWENGSAIFNLDAHLAETLGYYYDEAVKNKYFLGCTGWSIVEDFSTEFKLSLSDELRDEWKADEHQLASDIAKFYDGCKYWGD